MVKFITRDFFVKKKIVIQKRLIFHGNCDIQGLHQQGG